MAKILKPQFFNRPTQAVAQYLLGKFIVRKYKGKETALMITEVEAYDGPNDKASHAHRGETERNKIMFGAAGYWYVYFTYGVHWMLNISTGPKGYPAAVLIRGTDKISGPARLTKFLRIDKKLNNKKSVRASGLWIEDRGVVVKTSQIKKTPRIGIESSGPIWSKKPYRYILIY
ncbi:MAG: DNA-3-methyladenine glycosylase [Patescibacteria group bacterium]